MRELLKAESRRFVLHCLTGIVVVAAHWLAMWFLLQLGSTPLLATSVGFCLGALTRFFLSWKLVFTPSVSTLHSGSWFVVMLAVQFFLNGALFTLLHDAAPMQALIDDADRLTWIAQAVTTVVVTSFNFLAYRLWVFR